MGCPPVVSNVGELNYAVKHGENGYLVDGFVPEVIAGHLGELLSNKKKLAEFSEAAFQSASQYDLEATSQIWDRILNPNA